MKMAIVHDMIVDRGGAERVLYYFHLAFPNVPIYTTAYIPNSTYPEFKTAIIHSTWYDKIATTNDKYRKLYFPLGYIASKSIDLREYDLVLQSTTHGAKYARYKSDAIVISYCHTPFRLVWDTDSYENVSRSKGIKKILLNSVIKYLRKADYESAQRPNYFLANTQETASRITNCYNKKVDFILNPPVDCNKFIVSDFIEDYYLIVSRLEPYKKVDLAIKVFNMLGIPLKIVGSGTQKEYLRSIAKSNIEFVQGISDNDLAMLYSHAKGFLFPQYEDYGITPLEANASGRPVIAFSKGGVLETMVPYNGINANTATAIFFDEQTEESLIEAIKIFCNVNFNSNEIRKHAEKYDVPMFIKKIKSIVETIARKNTLEKSKLEYGINKQIS